MVRRIAVALLAGLVVVAAVSGCSRDGTGTAAASTANSSSAASPEWDPCTIPDEGARAAGLKPESKSSRFTGILEPGWKFCSWRAAAGWYAVALYSTPKPLQETYKRHTIHDPHTVTIGGQEAIQFRDTIDDEMCTVVVGRGNRTIHTVVNVSIAGRQGDECAEVLSVTTKLEKYYR